MVPDFNLEESEERALRDLDRSVNPVDLVSDPGELEDLQENLEGDESLNEDLPEDFVHIVQARSPRTPKTVQPHFPDTGIGQFIAEKTEAFHMSRVSIMKEDEPDIIDATLLKKAEVVDMDDDEEALEGVYTEEELEAMRDLPESAYGTTPEGVREQEELQAAHITEKKFKFTLAGRYNA